MDNLTAREIQRRVLSRWLRERLILLRPADLPSASDIRTLEARARGASGWRTASSEAGEARGEKGERMINTKIESLRRAAGAVVEVLAGRSELIRHTRFERADALAEAVAVKIIAAGVLAAAEAAIAEWQPPPPAENHYHQSPRPSFPPRSGRETVTADG
jgi:hypothetical protein